MSETSNSQKPISLEGLRKNNSNLEKKFSKEFISKDKIGDGLSVNEMGILEVSGFHVPMAFLVPVSAWTGFNDPDFPFTAEITDSVVTADHIVHFDFDKASIKAAMESVVITGETSEGKIMLLAEKAPIMELSGVYNITRKGAVE